MCSTPKAIKATGQIGATAKRLILPDLLVHYDDVIMKIITCSHRVVLHYLKWLMPAILCPYNACTRVPIAACCSAGIAMYHSVAAEGVAFSCARLHTWELITIFINVFAQQGDSWHMTWQLRQVCTTTPSQLKHTLRATCRGRSNNRTVSLRQGQSAVDSLWS